MTDVDDTRAAQPADPQSAPADATDAAVTPLESLGLSRGDVRFALVCGAAILLLLVAHWAQRAWHGARLVEIDRLPSTAYELQLEINSATWVVWMQLEGIGEVLARRIVANREELGPFAGIDDLNRVPGIGQKTLDEIRPHLICSEETHSDGDAGSEPPP
jgi:competence protein ComEA